MKRMQSGFTLIELVVVIVILGILAVTAVPRFIDLSNEAADAALQGVVGAVESASAINYAAASAGSTDKFTTVSLDCDDAVAGLLTGGAPSGYTITGTVGATAGVPSDCTITPNEAGTIPSMVAKVIAVN